MACWTMRESGVREGPVGAPGTHLTATASHTLLLPSLQYLAQDQGLAQHMAQTALPRLLHHTGTTWTKQLSTDSWEREKLPEPPTPAGTLHGEQDATSQSHNSSLVL